MMMKLIHVFRHMFFGRAKHTKPTRLIRLTNERDMLRRRLDAAHHEHNLLVADLKDAQEEIDRVRKHSEMLKDLYRIAEFKPPEAGTAIREKLDHLAPHTSEDPDHA